VPDAVRRAVARTIQSTLGPAALTRERAQELADDVLRQAEHRLRDAISDLRGADSSEVDEVRTELEQLRRRVDALERKLATKRSPSKH